MISTLEEISKIKISQKKTNETVGLITGCFDILHSGHISLLNFAKSRCNILIIGLENDETIKINKGSNRPVNSLEKRLFTINNLKSVDYVFSIEDVYHFNSEEANTIQENILKKIAPTYLITNQKADLYWKKKLAKANKLGIDLLLQDSLDFDDSTTDIIKRAKETV